MAIRMITARILLSLFLATFVVALTTNFTTADQITQDAGGSFQCPDGCDNPTNGSDGYGGLGGNGGNGKDCNIAGAIARFTNTDDVELTFSAGQGGNGGGDGSDCVVGGNGYDAGSVGASGGGGGSFSFV